MLVTRQKMSFLPEKCADQHGQLKKVTGEGSATVIGDMMPTLSRSGQRQAFYCEEPIVS